MAWTPASRRNQNIQEVILTEIKMRRFQQLRLIPSVDDGKAVGLLFTFSNSETPVGMVAPIDLLHEVYQQIPDLLASAQQARAKAGVGLPAPLRTTVAGWRASECRVAMEAEGIRLEYCLNADCNVAIRTSREMAERISAALVAALGVPGDTSAPVVPPQSADRTESDAQAESAAPLRKRKRSPERETGAEAKRKPSDRTRIKRVTQKNSR